MAAGWSLDIPVMEILTDKKFIHLGVEGTYAIGEDGYLNGRNLKDIKVQSDTSYTYDGATSAYSMTQADGIVWYFNSGGKPLAVKDKYDSYMRYYYVTSGDMKGYIDRIVDTVGRVIKFNYTGKYGHVGNDNVIWYFPQTITVNVYESDNTLSQPLFSWVYNTGQQATIHHTLHQYSHQWENRYCLAIWLAVVVSGTTIIVNHFINFATCIMRYCLAYNTPMEV